MVSVVFFCVQLFWWFLHKPSEKYWAISPKAKPKISEKTLSTFQKCLFEQVSAFFFGCNQWKLFWELPQISLLGTIRVFFRMQSHVSAGLVFDDYVWYFWSFLSRVWDVLGYRILKKTAFGFLETWCPSFCIVCNCFDDFCTNLLKKIGRFHRKQNPKFPKRRWVRSKNVFLSKSLLFSLVVTNESCFENFLRSLYLEQYVFFVRMQSHVSAGLVFDGYVWYFWSFLSRVWDVLGYRILKKTAFDFLETWCPSFCIVCNCFDDFRTNLPKTFGRFHWKENTNFSKRRWVRSRFVCLSSALLFSLVVTKKYVLRTSWGISARSNTCFLFKCRVTLRLR